MTQDIPEWQCEDCGGTDCHVCQREWEQQVASYDFLTVQEIEDARKYKRIIEAHTVLLGDGPNGFRKQVVFGGAIYDIQVRVSPADILSLKIVLPRSGRTDENPPEWTGQGADEDFFVPRETEFSRGVMIRRFWHDGERAHSEDVPTIDADPLT